MKPVEYVHPAMERSLGREWPRETVGSLVCVAGDFAATGFPRTMGISVDGWFGGGQKSVVAEKTMPWVFANAVS